jgi:hypothetical protein
MLKAADLQAQATALGLPASAATSVAFYQAAAIDRMADAISGLNLTALGTALTTLAPTFTAAVYGDAGKTIAEQNLVLRKAEDAIDAQRMQVATQDQTMAQNFLATLAPLVAAWINSAQLQGGTTPAIAKTS